MGPRRADYSRDMGAHLCRLVVQIGDISSKDRVVLGNAIKGTRTTVNGKPAFGMFHPWDRPLRKIEELQFYVDGKRIPISRDCWSDVFNAWAEERQGTTPVSGSLSLVGTKKPGHWLLVLSPMALVNFAKQGFNAEVRWDIASSGAVVRTIRNMSSLKVEDHSVFEPVAARAF